MHQHCLIIWRIKIPLKCYKKIAGYAVHTVHQHRRPNFRNLLLPKCHRSRSNYAAISVTLQRSGGFEGKRCTWRMCALLCGSRITCCRIIGVRDMQSEIAWNDPRCTIFWRRFDWLQSNRRASSAPACRSPEQVRFGVRFDFYDLPRHMRRPFCRFIDFYYPAISEFAQ